MRKMRKQVTGGFNPWNQDIEVGDRLYDYQQNKVYDIYISTGRDKRAMGELSYKEPITQKNGKKAMQINGIWYWD